MADGAVRARFADGRLGTESVVAQQPAIAGPGEIPLSFKWKNVTIADELVSQVIRRLGSVWFQRLGREDADGPALVFGVIVLES